MDRLKNFGFVLKDVTRLFIKRYEERAAVSLSLTLAQCKALITLFKNEGISQKRLCELADIEPMTLVRILDRMEAEGYIERRDDPADRRARTLYVTKKASPILDHIWEVSAQTRQEMFAGLTTEERNTLLTLLERVHENLLSLKPIAESPQSSPPRGAPAIKPPASTNRKSTAPR